MAVKFTNNASTQLTTSITDVATSFDVDSVALFPTVGGVDYMYLTIVSITDIEIIKVTSVTGTTLTCLRGQDGTVASSFAAGAAVELRACAAMFIDGATDLAAPAAIGNTTPNTIAGTVGTFNSLVVTGNVDGRDVSADGTKVDTIETGADVTDAVNVDAAGAVMESDYSNNSLRIKNNAGVMASVALAASELVGRKSTGDVANLTAAEARVILNVADGAQVNPSDAAIKTAYEANANTNAFTDTKSTKLDGIEDGATATAATDLTAPGPIGSVTASTGAFTTLTSTTSLDIGSTIAITGVLDEDNMSSNSAVKLATQQSIKAYVDALPAPTIAAGSITQTEIGAAAVGQGELKTTTGDMTQAQGGFSLQTGPGGEYGFWPTVKVASGAGNKHALVGALSDSHADSSNYGYYSRPITLYTTIGNTLLQRFTLSNKETYQNGGAGTLTARQRYVQSSPPYDLGEGEVMGFIFALINNATSDIMSMWMAQDPPWALNGPTNITPDIIINGKKYKEVQPKLKVGDLTIAQRNQFINGDFDLNNGPKTLIEITHAVKNEDMALIPHPYQGNDLTLQSLVMLDPMAKLTLRAIEMMKDGDCPAQDIFHEGFTKIDNVALQNRCCPPGVFMHKAKLK